MWEKSNGQKHQDHTLSRLDMIKTILFLPGKYLDLKEKTKLGAYMSIHSELVQLKDKTVQWNKNGRIIKLRTTLAERQNLLLEKDQLISVLYLL